MVYIEKKQTGVVVEDSKLIYEINTKDFYNLLQDTGPTKLIIDLRNKEAFEKNHIITAINIQPPTVPIVPNDDGANTTTTIASASTTIIENFNLTKYIGSFAKLWNLIFQKVIIYSDKLISYNEVELKEYLKECNNSSGGARNDQDIIKSYDCSGSEGWEITILKHFLKYKKSVKILIYNGSGFNEFESKYSYLCNGSSNSGNSSSRMTSTSQLYPTDIIDDFLYLGNIDNARSRIQINNLKITHIINMASELEDSYTHLLKYYRADLDDSPKVLINIHFEPIIKFINDAKLNGGRVLVHCAMGISRSSAVVIAYLMSELSMSYIDAWKYCKEKRSIVNPNFGFVKQLKDYQIYLEEENKKKKNLI